MATTYNDALEHVLEALEHSGPSREDADRALHEFIDARLGSSELYDLWDGSTHYEVNLAQHETIYEAVVSSTYFQLMDQWGDAVNEALEIMEAEEDDED